jgi:hypothetical protein
MTFHRVGACEHGDDSREGLQACLGTRRMVSHEPPAVGRHGRRCNKLS